MSHFPVTNSNLSAAALGVFISERYGLTTAGTCTFIKAGINDTYRLSDERGKYVFRVYSLNWRTRLEITEEIRILAVLRDHGVRVSSAIADNNGEYLQSLEAPEGLRYGVLFSFAEGEKIHNLPASTHFEVGMLMGRLHKILEGQSVARTTYTPERLLVQSLQEVEKFLSADCAEMNFMKSTQKLLLKALDKMDVRAFRRGIVHMDIWFDNLNVNADNQVTLFDFDFCGNGWLSLDIAYYVMQLHNLEKYEEKNYLPKVQSFMRGYESVVAISDEEKEHLPVLGVCLYYFYLGIQSQRYDNWSNTFLSEDYLKRFINGLVRRYFDIYKLGERLVGDLASEVA